MTFQLGTAMWPNSDQWDINGGSGKPFKKGQTGFSSSCLKARCHPSCAHIDKSHPLRWPNGKMEKNPNNMVEICISYGPPTPVCFYWRKINSSAKTTVSKTFCNLQSNAFLTDPTLSVHALQLMNSFSPAIEHTSKVQIANNWKLVCPTQTRIWLFPPQIYSSQNCPTWGAKWNSFSKYCISVTQSYTGHARMECVIKRIQIMICFGGKFFSSFHKFCFNGQVPGVNGLREAPEAQWALNSRVKIGKRNSAVTLKPRNGFPNDSRQGDLNI